MKFLKLPLEVRWHRKATSGCNLANCIVSLRQKATGSSDSQLIYVFRNSIVRTKADAAVAALAAAQAAMTQATNENDAAKKTAESLIAVTPLLKDAADMANAAAAQPPSDESLKNAALAITTTSNVKVMEMEAAKTGEATKLVAMQQATTVMADTQNLSTDMAAALASAQQTEATLLPLLKPAEEAFNAPKTMMNQSAAAVASATASVAKWSSEIEFSNKFKALHQQRADGDRCRCHAA